MFVYEINKTYIKICRDILQNRSEQDRHEYKNTRGYTFPKKQLYLNGYKLYSRKGTKHYELFGIIKYILEQGKAVYKPNQNKKRLVKSLYL